MKMAFTLVYILRYELRLFSWAKVNTCLFNIHQLQKKVEICIVNITDIMG